MSERSLWETNADDPGRPKCYDCRYFRRKGEKCQRFPQTPYFDVGTLERVIMFPRVSSQMWCGEFAARLAEPADAARSASPPSSEGESSRADLDPLSHHFAGGREP